MLNAGVLTFQEFLMHESLPLSTLHDAILEFLRGREDSALFGAHAVNAYVNEPRMTQDIDILSVQAAELVKELRANLQKRFQIAVRIRKVESKGFRLYQVQKPRNRHLADVRIIERLPAVKSIDHIQVMAPADLIASKVVAYHQRRGQPKSGTDWRDVAMLLLTFPALKTPTGDVCDRLHKLKADPEVFKLWQELVNQEIQPPDDAEDW
jgi:hypothetical protein